MNLQCTKNGIFQNDLTNYTYRCVQIYDGNFSIVDDSIWILVFVVCKSTKMSESMKTLKTSSQNISVVYYVYMPLMLMLMSLW